MYSHQLPRGLIPALSGYVWRILPGKPLKLIHHDPIPRSAAASIPFRHPLSDKPPGSAIVQPTLHHPLPDKHCCHDPKTPLASMR